MDRYIIVMTIILLLGAAMLARLWVLVGRDDVELFGEDG